TDRGPVCNRQYRQRLQATMQRIDLALCVLAFAAIGLIGEGGCSRGWEPDDEESNRGLYNLMMPAVRRSVRRDLLTHEGENFVYGLNKRAMRLMRIGRRSWDGWNEEADKRAMRLMRIGRRASDGFYRPSIRYGRK
uniref:Neuropeptide n=2 Tax=Macrostomum lignano TaxID=282301 RepID=A0A1I8GHT4_9PLAT